jgi:hypothetical protein
LRRTRYRSRPPSTLMPGTHTDLTGAGEPVRRTALPNDVESAVVRDGEPLASEEPEPPSRLNRPFTCRSSTVVDDARA